MSLASMGSNGRPTDDSDECEAAKSAISSYLAREEEIERRKMEVKERVESQLNRAEEETRRLAQVWEVIKHAPCLNYSFFIFKFFLVQVASMKRVKISNISNNYEPLISKISVHGSSLYNII